MSKMDVAYTSGEGCVAVNIVTSLFASIFE